MNNVGEGNYLDLNSDTISYLDEIADKGEWA